MGQWLTANQRRAELALTEVNAMAIIPPLANDGRVPGKGGQKVRPLIALTQMVFALSCTLQGCGKVGTDSVARPVRLDQPAPEIEGEDLDGQPLKLSDYRGKVVLLSFYGEWCLYCVKQFPNEKALVEKYGDRPFVLLGVNSDADRTEAKQAALRHGLTWRAFWAQSADGKIPRRYNVRSWPTFILIDAQGTVRHVGHQADRELEVAIRVLLDEVENGPKTALNAK
jgi:peroxiredoxin